MDTSSSARGCVIIVTPKPLSRRIKCASVTRRTHGKRGALRGSAPTDNHTLYFASFVPLELSEGGHQAWDSIKEARADWLMSRLARYAPNVSGDNILARHVDSPLDMSRHSPSFKFGDVVGIAMYIYQFFGRRPTPELAQYRVPGAKGLYLSGPFMHPGGGITGGGRATAIRVMEDLGLDYSHVISS